MRTFIISFLSCLLIYKASAQGRYTYADNCIQVLVEWGKDTTGSEIISLTLKPSVDIWVLDNAGCFDIDTNAVGIFRNVNCPFYIISQCFNSTYKAVKRDSAVIYQWKVPVGKSLKVFSFEIEYIATTTHAYQSKKSRLIKIINDNRREKLSVAIEDEKKLLSKAYLKIEK